MANVLVPLAQGCEELEAVTITDILTRAGVTVTTVSLDDEKVITASRGMKLIAQYSLGEVMDKSFDMIVLPGGLPGADYLNDDKRIRKMLTHTLAQGGIVAAVCAAPKVLLSAGLLQGRSVTSYPGALGDYDKNTLNYFDQEVVVDGSIITARGPAAAMPFALALVKALKGERVRAMIASQLLYE